MRRSDLTLPRLILFLFCLTFMPIAVRSQTAPIQSRIVERVNEGALVTLRGNTHPLAQPGFDQGVAPPDLPMARMLLVLKRSDAQQSALQKLLEDQQDRNSPSYHLWLTPDMFGRQFGPSDQDIQVVAAWLSSHGFQIGGISLGRTVIEFSGTALQVHQAFHTEIHRYLVNGENHWANASDPQIPAALSAVIEGINSLHNFPKKPTYRLAGKFTNSETPGSVRDLGPEFTTNDTSLCGPASCYFVSPYDFAMIYNVAPLWTAGIDGTGESIAIINESNIDVQDVRDFRNLFGLPSNDPQIILNGPDPGIVQGVESEADLDVEWSGAVAKGATIKLVVTAPTNSTEGVDLSAVYAVENNVAPIISESFGECELFLGNAGNSFQNAIRQQAAAQGITFINSSGDEGSARCDEYSGSLPDPATHGLQVSGLASSPYGVAVGGTDFLNFGSTYNLSSPSPYWGSTNDPQHEASALGYVPETTWNDSCTNAIFVFLEIGSNAEASCNNSKIANAIDTVGGGGGESSCTISGGTNTSSCSTGYAKPSWQSAPGVPADGVRDIPDVALFASAGFMNSAYILCESDQLPFPETCSLNTPNGTFLGIGGTSASAPAFAGIMALVNQFTGSSGQGNANYVLYNLASSAAQTSQSCGATSNPSTTGCIYYDVTSGTNAVPCAKGSPNCITTVSSDTYGVLSGYSAGGGYDLATGLGSVNAFNLVHNWIQPSASSNTTLSLDGGASVNITHGQTVNFNIVVAPSAAPGEVSLMGNPTGSGFIPMGSFPLQNGAASGTTTSLAGGTSYAVKAHYPGNGTYTPSDSSPVKITVMPEASKTLITIPVYDPTTGNETGNAPAAISYGTLVGVRVDVGNALAKTSFPPQLVCAPPDCPTGNVTVTDAVNGGTATPLVASGFPLNSGGYAEDDGLVISGGSHQIFASFGGDNSYQSSSASASLTVTPAATQLENPYIPYTPLVAATPVGIRAYINTSLFEGAAPTGTVTFYDGGTPISGTITYDGQSGIPTRLHANLEATINASLATSGVHQITFQYSGDSNYVGGTAGPTSIKVDYPTTAMATVSSSNVNLGQSVTITATVTTPGKNPPMTGTFLFNGYPPLPTTMTPTLTIDANGNQVLTAAITTTPQISQNFQVTYSGDSNYLGSNTTILVTVNIPDFRLAVGPSPITINAGQTGTSTITVTPSSNISSTVALSCAGLTGSSCSFNPVSPLTLSNGDAASTMVTITTLPPSPSPTTQMVMVRPTMHRRIPPGVPYLFALAGFLAIMFLSLSPAQATCRLVTNLGMIGLLGLLLSCGGSSGAGVGGAGGGNGGGGGNSGGSGPVATSLTLSTSALKQPIGTLVTFTATVTSSQPVTGTVTFLDSNVAFTSASIVNGTASVQESNMSIGTHIISAQYQGDANNEASKTIGSINQVITGNALISIIGATGGLTHSTYLTVTIQ
jgi:hypothetical protein